MSLNVSPTCPTCRHNPLPISDNFPEKFVDVRESQRNDRAVRRIRRPGWATIAQLGRTFGGLGWNRGSHPPIGGDEALCQIVSRIHASEQPKPISEHGPEGGNSTTARAIFRHGRESPRSPATPP